MTPQATFSLSGQSAWRHDVHVATNLLSSASLWAQLTDDYAAVAVVTDANVAKSVLPKLTDGLGQRADCVTIVPAGEASKNRDTKAKIESDWLRAGLGRDAIVIALGGGVVGDLTGFCAATYLRGIPVVQVPTSLVAMVDSSIGGKTGIDVPEGKNLIGAFHPPAAVIADVAALATLPDKELQHGLAEVVKHGIIADRDLLQRLSESLDDVFAGKTDVLIDLVASNMQIKGGVVERDEKEGGLRQILNLGHTVGHAIEALMHYGLPHGQAVAIGLVAELQMAVAARGFPVAAVDEVADLLDRIGLPVQVPNGLTAQAVVDAMATDKKVRKGRVRFAIPAMLGSFEPDSAHGYAMPLDQPAIIEGLERVL